MTMLWCWEMERLLLTVFVCGLPDDSCSPLPAHISASKTASSISRATAHCCYYIKSSKEAARLRKQVCDKERCRRKTLSIVQILVCKTAAASSSLGAQVRVITNPSWLHLINVDCSTCLLFQRERAATQLRYLDEFKSLQPVKPKNHVEDERLFWLWRRGRPRFPTYFCICHLFYWQHNFATTDRVGACWDMPEPRISMKKKIHMKVGTRT